MNRTAGLLHVVLAALLAAGMSGCAKLVREIPRHAKQERLERLLGLLKPYTSRPEAHYWIRVSEPAEHPIALAVLYQRHIYIAETLMERDDGFLSALVAHGMAHHRLHHHGKRDVLTVIQKAAFKVGGFFVPGLSHGWRLTDPLAQVAAGAKQEQAADDKTIKYLDEAGYSGRQWLNVLEFMVEQDYGERVGRIGYRDRQLTNRIERLRQKLQ